MPSLIKNAILLLGLLCSGLVWSHSIEQKVNGISFVAARFEVDKQHIAPLKASSANYVAIMPFGFISNSGKAPFITFNSTKQWYGERVEGVRSVVKQLQQEQIRIMLKPQLWVKNGKYTGELSFASEAQWQEFESAYTDFILTYAQVAAELEVDIFCLGTELQAFVAARSDYWFSLIAKVREVYSGKLTYAANWDEYKRTPFWQQLDYIGIDAYFPLSEQKTPSVEAIEQAWQGIKPELSRISHSHERPILFTEWGFRSVDYAAKKPWEHSYQAKGTNLRAQANAITGTLNALWSEPWFAGGFVWKWFANHERAGGHENNRFTPQNKPAEQVLSDFFKQ